MRTGNWTAYEDCLVAMEQLLSTVGETHWANWIREDINAWRRAAETSHHCSAYGGMGSFNDVWICRENRHSVSDDQEPWANTLFVWLRAVCHYFAKNPSAKPTADSMTRIVGCDDSSLAAFAGHSNALGNGLASVHFPLEGWICRECGHTRISSRDLNYFLAREMIPALVFLGCEKRTLGQLVESTLALDLDGLTDRSKQLTDALARSGLQVLEEAPWLRKCPNCGQGNIALHRWQLTVDGSLFESVPEQQGIFECLRRYVRRWLSR